MIAYAWDIETCPLPKHTFSDRRQRRYEKELARMKEREPHLSDIEASVKVRSLNPFLGYICCISIVRFEHDEMHAPHSYTAPLPENEADMLTAFWKDIRKTKWGTWVTFNGKRFDTEFLLTRTLAHHLKPSKQDILHRNPYNHKPHADLATLFRNHVGLADLCDLLGVESPKSNMDGSGVHQAVKDGRIDDVARYCEADVTATMFCYLAARDVLV